MADEVIVHRGGAVLQKRRVKRTSWTAAQRSRFFDSLAETCNVTLSAKLAGIDVSLAYHYRRTDPVFAEIWRQALTIGYQRLEEELLAHALTAVSSVAFAPSQRADGSGETLRPGAGLPRKVDGSPDVQLALALLNRHRATVEGDGKGGKTMRRATSQETDALLRKHLDALAKRLRSVKA